MCVQDQRTCCSAKLVGLLTYSFAQTKTKQKRTENQVEGSEGGTSSSEAVNFIQESVFITVITDQKEKSIRGKLGTKAQRMKASNESDEL